MLCRTEKEQRVIELYQQGKTIREIAQEVHMSFSDIGAIIKKVTGLQDDEINQKNKTRFHSSHSLKILKLSNCFRKSLLKWLLNRIWELM
jgi:cytidylate kinase